MVESRRGHGSSWPLECCTYLKGCEFDSFQLALKYSGVFLSTIAWIRNGGLCEESSNSFTLSIYSLLKRGTAKSSVFFACVLHSDTECVTEESKLFLVKGLCSSPSALCAEQVSPKCPMNSLEESSQHGVWGQYWPLSPYNAQSAKTPTSCRANSSSLPRICWVPMNQACAVQRQ